MDEQLVYELSLEFIKTAGLFIHGLDAGGRVATSTLMRRFAAHFGTTPRHCAYLWIHTEDGVKKQDNGGKKIHLLWSLNLLKTNATEHCMAGRWRADEKTIRKWTAILLEAISSLEVVSFCFTVCLYYTFLKHNLIMFFFLELPNPHGYSFSDASNFSECHASSADDAIINAPVRLIGIVVKTTVDLTAMFL
jgi:hypothetical protein